MKQALAVLALTLCYVESSRADPMNDQGAKVNHAVTQKQLTLTPVASKSQTQLAYGKGGWLLVPSPEGSLLAVGGIDGTVLLDTAALGERTRLSLPGPDLVPMALAFSSNGRLAISYGPKDTISGKGGASIYLYDVKTGKSQRLADTKNWLYGKKLRFSEDGTRLLVVGNPFSMWDKSSGRQVRVFPTIEWVDSAVMDNQGSLIAALSQAPLYHEELPDGSGHATLRPPAEFFTIEVATGKVSSSLVSACRSLLLCESTCTG